MYLIDAYDAIDLLSGRHYIGARSAHKGALEAPEQNYIIGASIIVGKRVLGFTHNLMEKSDPKGSGIHSTVHAEVRLLKHIGKYHANGTTIYVIRINKKNHIRTAKPCPDCYEMLKQYGVSCIVSSTNSGWLIEKIL